MLRKVRIKRLPQAKTGYQVRGSLYNDVPAMGGGADYNAYIGEPHLRASKYITAVPRDKANLEAEGGETVFGDINGDGMPEHKTIKGPRHAQGGVPLSLPDDSFIFSDTKSMRIKDPEFLTVFGKKSGSYTPADLAKQYDIEKYRKILQDPNSDALDRKTAELMLKNYTLKLGALALAQESKKGFPQGIPAVARPYMEAMGIKDEEVLPEKEITTTIEQLDKEQKTAATMASPTEEQDEEYGNEAEEAQMINSDRPVAQPEPEADEEAGMTPEETQMQYGGLFADRGFAFENGGWLPEEVAVFTGTVPYAEYGMAMGANPQNYQGRKKPMPGATRFFNVGGNLPKADGGIEVDISGMTPQQRDKALDEARTKNPGKEITVIEDGKKKKAKHTKLKAEELTDVEGVDMKSFGNTPNSIAAAAQYKLLEKNLQDPKVADKLYEETIKSLKDKRSYVDKKGHQGKTWEERGHQLPTKEEVTNQFLSEQKRNLSFRGQNIDPRIFNDEGSGLAPAEKLLKDGVINPKTGKKITNLEEAKEAKEHMRQTYGGGNNKKGYKDASGNILDVSVEEVSGKLGVPLENDEKARALQQATFHGYTHMAENKGDYDADTQYALKNFIPEGLQSGAGDEISMGKGLFKSKGLQISPIDDFGKLSDEKYVPNLGNTTLGHQAGAGLEKYEFEDIVEDIQPKEEPKEQPKEEPKEDPNKPCNCPQPDGTNKEVGRDPNTGECLPCEQDVEVDVEKPAEWWLQDTVKTTGAFGDLMSIKKHMPWAPKADLETPRPTFLDPTRELAANAEQANIQTQAAAQFAGPQAASARASSIQGTAAKNAADVLSRYNNANVNIANQFETQATNIRNQEQMMNQAATQRLYDQNTIANQQFDNAKLAMRSNLRNQYTNAITNRAKTAALNELYPQFAVSPGTGGFPEFKGGKDLTGKSTGSTKTYDELLKHYKDMGMEDADAIESAKTALKNQASSGGSSDKAAMAKQMGYGKKGGQLKKGGFVYADVIYPFIL